MLEIKKIIMVLQTDKTVIKEMEGKTELLSDGVMRLECNRWLTFDHRGWSPPVVCYLLQRRKLDRSWQEGHQQVLKIRKVVREDDLEDNGGWNVMKSR